MKKQDLISFSTSNKILNESQNAFEENNKESHFNSPTKQDKNIETTNGNPNFFDSFFFKNLQSPLNIISKMKKLNSPETHFTNSNNNNNSFITNPEELEKVISSVKEEEACELIVNQLLAKKEKWEDKEHQTKIIHLLQIIFNKMNEKDSSLLRKIIPLKLYETLFKMIFSWKNCSSVFGLICLDFEYSKKLSQNFFVLANFLTNNINYIDPVTYIKFFIRISFFVSQKFETVKNSFGKIAADIQNNSEVQNILMKRLETMKEFKIIEQLNKNEINENNFDLNEISKKEIAEIIYKALKITESFPFIQFLTINKNLSVIFFRYCFENKFLKENQFWNSLILSTDRLPSPKIVQVTEMLQQVIKKLIQAKVLIECLLKEGDTSNTSSIMKSLQFNVKRKFSEIELSFLQKINDFSFCNDNILNEEFLNLKKLTEKCLDSKIFLFKKLIVICLHSIYFIEYCIRNIPILAKTAFVIRAYPIFNSLIKFCCKFGTLITKHAKCISLNSRYLLKGIDDKNAGQFKNMKSTVIKIKRVYESIFVFMNEKRKLYNVIKNGRKEIDEELFTIMQRFIF